jgi:uncharacterized protein
MYNYLMHVVWDKNKNTANIKKHKVSFEEAQTVFYDPITKIAKDPDHSDEEDRFIAVGYSIMDRLLLVVHCYREGDQIIRVISARKLTNPERRQFEEELL